MVENIIGIVGRRHAGLGLPEIVADEEDLARFLTSSSQFNTQVVKHAAFLPSQNDGVTSVFPAGASHVTRCAK